MFKKVLVATDGSPHAEKAVAVGADIASKYGAALCIVHVLLGGEPSESLKRMAEVEHLLGEAKQPSPPPSQGPELGAVGYRTRTAEEEARSYRILNAIGEKVLESSCAIAREHGIRDASTRIVDGDPTKEILKAAEEESSDLLVCGARGLSDLRALLLGSVSHKLSHLSPMTCITVR